MVEHNSRGEPGVVHKSAHPSLPPAAPQQVVQYLLAKNYHLTALELLVEAQQAGHGDDVRDLEAFFADADRFPPEELARYQAPNALDVQAVAREREARLQMAEYELRLAKEDLAEMSRKLATANASLEQQQQQQQGTALVTAGVAGEDLRATQRPSPSRSPSAAPGPEGGAAASRPSTAGATAGGILSIPASPGPPWLPSPAGFSPGSAAPSAADLKVLNAAVFAHLKRQGLVTTAMTMEEEYGGPLRPAAGQGASPATVTHGSGAGGEQGWELWAWYQAAAGAAAASAAAATAADAVGTAASDIVAAPATAEDAELGLELGDSEQDSSTGPELGSEEDLEAATPEQLRAALLAARKELAATRSRARAALARSSQRQLQLQQQLLRSPAPPPLPPLLASPPQTRYPTSDISILELLDLTPKAQQPVAQDAASTTGATALPPSSSTGAATAETQPSVPPPAQPAPGSDSGLPSRTSLAGDEPRDQQPDASAAAGTSTSAPLSPRPPWLRHREQPEIDRAYHASLESLLGRLTELLPKLVPSLTLKSRLEVLPLLVSAAKTSPEWGVRRQLLIAAFNLAPAPDATQRQAILDACLDLCRSFGAGWAASELLPLCGRQASSPSSERRTLVAEALGAAVGCVEAGTQGHVLLTQLAQLARDRTEQVREAACHSLARLVPRLPFGRSYYTTLEGLLLALATDAAEPVAAAALSYLVPALLTWQPTDGDGGGGGGAAGVGGGGMLLVSSCLARVMSELGQHVRQIEQRQKAAQAQAQVQKTTVAAEGSVATAASSGGAGGGGGGSGFAGSLLRYSAPGSATAPEAPHAPPPSPLPLAHPVSYGRRSFPSAAHLAACQLLALYVGLTPALRAAALRSAPQWAGAAPDAARRTPSPGPTAAATLAGRDSQPPHATPSPSRGRSHHHRTGSTGSPILSLDTDFEAGSGPAPGELSFRERERAGALSPGHRRTASHPVLSAAAAAAGGAAAGGSGSGVGGGSMDGSATGRGGGARHLTVNLSLLWSPDAAPTPRLDAPATSGRLPIGADPATPPPPTQQQEQREGQGEAAVLGDGAQEGRRRSGPGGSGLAGTPGSTTPERDPADVADDACLARWASHPAHASWKTLEWVMQHVVPELLRLLAAAGPSLGPEAAELRRRAAGAVAATCEALGAPFTTAAVLPVFFAASGYGLSATALASGAAPADVQAPVPVAVADLVTAVQPKTSEALRAARQCVLPALLGCVLPASGQLRPHLVGLLGAAHELRHRWLMEALPEYTAALTAAATLRPTILPELLHTFEDLLSGSAKINNDNGHNGNASTAAEAPTEGGGGATAAAPPAPAAASAATAGPASTSAGLCCAALARALVPLASLEVAARRLLPGLMALMSYGEPELQRACVGVLAELGLRFRADGPRVSEQVLTVYDSLLEQGAHAVRLEVLSRGTAMAAAAAPSAAVSAAAAAQVEWLLAAVQAVATRLTATPAGPVGGSGGGSGNAAPTQEQQRALAAQLLGSLRAVAPYDLRLPRLQAHMSAALEAVSRCKALLPEPSQQAALAALLKERPTGHSPAGGGVSVSSSTPTPGTAHPRLPHHTSPAPLPHAAGSAPLTPLAGATGGALFATPPSLPQTHSADSVAAAGATPESGQPRSRFDAFKQRFLKRKDDVAAAAGGTTPQASVGGAGGGELGGGAGGRPKENFFSDDEGE